MALNGHEREKGQLETPASGALGGGAIDREAQTVYLDAKHDIFMGLAWEEEKAGGLATNITSLLVQGFIDLDELEVAGVRLSGLSKGAEMGSAREGLGEGTVAARALARDGD